MKLSSSSCVESFKVLLDPALLLEEQVSVSAKSAFYHLNMVCSLLHILDSANDLILIQAFVLGLMAYTAWDSP